MKLTDVETIKRCPVCGSEPMGVCYTSNPPQYGYSHCDIDSGYCKSEPEAREKWNEQVYLHQQKKNEKTDAERIVENLGIFLAREMFFQRCLYDSHSHRRGIANLLEDTIKLINGQKAEIERLQKEVDRLSQCVLYHDGQIVDAIKEFAERLKEYIPHFSDGYTTMQCVEGAVKYLVKETVGDNDV